MSPVRKQKSNATLYAIQAHWQSLGAQSNLETKADESPKVQFKNMFRFCILVFFSFMRTKNEKMLFKLQFPTSNGFLPCS